MKNKRKMMITAMFVSMAMLVLAGVANAASISGYFSFKEGIKNTIALKNATIEAFAYATLNGQRQDDDTEEMIYKYDLDNDIKYSKSGSSYKSENYTFKEKGTNKITNVHVSRYNYYSDEETENVNSYTYNDHDDEFDSMFGVSPEVIRIVEILADALSGNAKDYFFTNESDGVKTITARIDKEQMPEIISAVFDLGNSIINKFTYDYYDDVDYEYTQDPDDTPFDDLNEKINNGFITKIEFAQANIYAELSDDNVITEAKIEATIQFTDKNGTIDEITATYEVKVTEIGTTSIAVPAELLEKAEQQRKERENLYKEVHDWYYEDETDWDETDWYEEEPII